LEKALIEKDVSIINNSFFIGYAYQKKKVKIR
jgi:hypothetical protein